MAGQFYQTHGPTLRPQGFKRSNLFGKYHTHLSRHSGLSFSAGGFTSSRSASGQIPQRVVRNGLISRFGALDDLEGGVTGRQNVSLAFSMTGENSSELHLQGYVSRYTFKLFSDFTFFLNDPVDGDMIEQTDHRTLFGINTRYRIQNDVFGALFTTTIGGGFRADDIAVELWRSPGRQCQEAHVDADIQERKFFLWIQEEAVIHPKFRIQLGLRQDYFTFDVNDHLEILPSNTGLPHVSGAHQESMLNPKFNMVFSPGRHVEIYLNSGSGFHSNDARNVVIARGMTDFERSLRRAGQNDAQIETAFSARHFDPTQRGIRALPRAIGSELGVRTTIKNATLAVALWRLSLEEELAWVGDEGTTEIKGATRRTGFDFEARLQPYPSGSGSDLNRRPDAEASFRFRRGSAIPSYWKTTGQ
ncbi:MAG: TonB-dependent receptor [candidate division Zixibacteria bacterium]|nr:TonB-dependent receptor [candidate division Zixibacteria bacterium]